MTYRLIKGEFVLFHPDLPCQGPEPDGDTLKFVPDETSLVETLPRFGERAPRMNGRGAVNLRFEAIDALETHYPLDGHGDIHQQEALGNAARDRVLAEIGFDNITFCVNDAAKMNDANSDRRPGAVLANGIDTYGRVISFVYRDRADNISTVDGVEVRATPQQIDASVNRDLIAQGLAYASFYQSLPGELRDHLAVISSAARANGTGIWAPPPGGDDGSPVPVGAGLADLQTAVIFPKLFRRLAGFFNSPSGSDLWNFDRWLRDNSDDFVRLLPGAAPVLDTNGQIA